MLLIEDDSEDADQLQETLEKCENLLADVTWAQNLSEGMAYARQREFDIVLLDLGLPDCEGLDSLAGLLETLQDVPIIIFSGLDHQTLAVKALQMGVQDYLVKGRFDVDSLTRAIQFAIERHKRLVRLKLNQSFAKTDC